jgi:CheY-like chemotaxis protein
MRDDELVGPLPWSHLMLEHNRPKRILIVDDESTLVFFLKQGLQESGIPCLVDNAASGEEALTKLTYNRYDVLVTDLKMPGITGFTLLEVARSLHPDISVILMTAFGSPEVQDEAKRLKVDGYLTKPFPTAQLQSIVSNVLTTKNRPKSQKDENLQNVVVKQNTE